MRRRFVAIAAAVVALAAVIAWLARGGDDGAARSPHAQSRSEALAKLLVQASRGDTALARGGRRIAGVVTFEGAPASGASVRLVERFGLAERRVAADDRGGFDFGPQLLARYVVIAEMPKRTGAVASIDLRDPNAQPDQLRLVLHTCDASLHGIVRDTGGGVVPKARVEVVWGDATAGLASEADADGNYELCVVRASVRAVARADGYASHGDDIAAFGRVRHDFLLSPAADLHGRVVRASDQTPVAGATIEVEPEGSRPEPTLFASSRDDGTFRVEGVASGRYLLRATAERLASAQPVTAIAEVGRSSDVMCSVVPSLEISGKVVVHGSGAPAGGLTITFAQRAMPGHHPLEAVSQPDGSFVIEHVLPGTYQPWVTPARLAGIPPHAIVTDADVRNVVVEVEPPGSITGRITSGGKPVEGAEVHPTTWDVVVQSDQDGRYTLRGLSAGDYQIYAESQRVGAFSNGPKITLAPAEQKTGIDIELDLAASISGVVVDQAGAPVAGAYVRFSLLHGRNDSGLATTADDGTFSARALAGGGEYAVEVRPAEMSPMKYRSVHGRIFPAITVRDSQSHVENVRIEIRREQLAISGRVVDGTGAPVPDVLVEAMSAERSRWGVVTVTSDIRGAFTLHELVAGTYSVRAYGARGEQHADVVAGRSDVVLQLDAFGRIEGTLEGFAEPPGVVAWGEGVRRYAAVTSGTTFVIDGVAPGKYDVLASSPTGMARATVDVSAGTTARAELRIRGFGTIEGSIVDDKTHAPVPSMWCSAEGGQGAEDSNGTYRLEQVLSGFSKVVCAGRGHLASADVDVVAGQTVRLDLVAHATPPPPRGYIGLTAEDQAGDVVVISVMPNGPAARAGLAVGDVVTKVDDMPADEVYFSEAPVMYRPIGSMMKLELERGDTHLTVTITIAAPA